MTRKLKLPETEITRRRRGNTTSGADRRGFKGGREPLYPEGTITRFVALKLSDPEYAIAIWAGRGIAAKGVRMAISEWAKSHPLPPGIAELDGFSMETRLKKDKQALRIAKASRALPDWDDIDD